MNKRITNLIKLLPNDFEAAIIKTNKNRQYFCMQDTHDAGLILILKKQSYFIIDFRYYEICEKNVKDINVVLQDKLYEQINDIIKQNNIQKIYLEDIISVNTKNNFEQNLKCEIICDSILTDAINNIRIVKEDNELENIKKAQKITDKAFEFILTQIEIGKTEKQLKLMLDYFMLENGADDLAFDTIFLTGTNTSLPHGIPSLRKIKKGDFITIDFGAVVNGYCTDMTRTFAVGKPTDEMINIYDIVKTAQQKALNKVQSGLACCEIDKTARDYIKQKGFDDYFGHTTGHGVGLDIHENPRVGKNDKIILQENMVITIEPGIYLPEKFGVRIEDTVIVKQNKCEIYGKKTKELIIL